MAYILSRQLAAISLNRECGFLADSPIVLITCGGELMDLDDVVTYAEMLLCPYPETYGNSEDPDVLAAHAEQEAIKDCLDKVNNNTEPAWVASPIPCDDTPIPCP
jgi:hypothetical protein